MTDKRFEQLWQLWTEERETGDSTWRKGLTQEEQSKVDDWDEEAEDAHSCREHSNDYGLCTWCGAIIPGTPADYTEHGYDPPELDYEFDW